MQHLWTERWTKWSCSRAHVPSTKKAQWVRVLKKRENWPHHGNIFKSSRNFQFITLRTVPGKGCITVIFITSFKSSLQLIVFFSKSIACSTAWCRILRFSEKKKKKHQINQRDLVFRRDPWLYDPPSGQQTRCLSLWGINHSFSFSFINGTCAVVSRPAMRKFKTRSLGRGMGKSSRI